MRKSQRFWFGLFALPATALTLVGVSLAQQDGPIGQVQQPLVGGSIVSPDRQEEFGLLTISDGCSASLLRNGWAITAAHCVDARNPQGNPMPDPNRPGQNILKPLNSYQIVANWKTNQTRRPVRVDTFWPYDVALIQLDAPISVRGRTTGYSRLIFQDGQFPYFGEPTGASLMLFGRGIHAFAKAPSTPAQGDGRYRTAYARPNRNNGTLYWYPSEGGKMIAGGDSGGPSFAWVMGGWSLVGVHALTKANYVPGKPRTGWTWVTSTPEAADAPIAPIWNRISAIMGPIPPGDPEPAVEPPPPGFIGVFAKTPPDLDPLWLYGIRPSGDMMWYRRDSNSSAWQGPRRVGTGWMQFKNVIPAGGNNYYALTTDNKLLWYKHNGFNGGTFDWKGGHVINEGWSFKRIFPGGMGILYAVRQDGKLFWYRHIGYKFGTNQWSQPREIGTGWGDFKDIFSTGKGAIYAVKNTGQLLMYNHTDYKNGSAQWGETREVAASGWNNFRQIIPVMDGKILAITPTGKLLWYRHLGKVPALPVAIKQFPGQRTSVAIAQAPIRPLKKMGKSVVKTPVHNPVVLAPLKPLKRMGKSKVTYREGWEGPIEIGSGWQDYGKVVAMMEAEPDPIK